MHKQTPNLQQWLGHCVSNHMNTIRSEDHHQNPGWSRKTNFALHVRVLKTSWSWDQAYHHTVTANEVLHNRLFAQQVPSPEFTGLFLGSPPPLKLPRMLNPPRPLWPLLNWFLLLFLFFFEPVFCFFSGGRDFLLSSLYCSKSFWASSFCNST